jgi:glycosyltransferase involved in cell wall biosynthesis
MHILQILPQLNQGGVERGTVELNRELVKRGHTSTVISAGGRQAEQIENDGGTHISLDVYSKNLLTVPFRVRLLRKKLTELSPDVVHVRSRVPAWLTYFANKSLNLPFVTTVHGFNSVSKYSEIMTKGDLFICASQPIKEYVIKHYAPDMSRLRMVPRGIDMTYFAPESPDRVFINHFKQQHRITDRHLITMVGRITEWKGHDTFLHAFSQIAAAQPNATALIVGDIQPGKETYFESLKTFVRDHNLENRVVWAGHHAEVREFYAMSDLVVSAASFKPESFGRVAAESLAMNTPVIASAQGGSLEIVCDNENGMLFPPQDADALANCLRRAQDYPFQNMREHIANNFSLETMVDKTLSVYGECTSNTQLKQKTP